MQAERFADEPAKSVALNAAARGTNRDSKPETWPTFVVPERDHAKESIAKPPATRISGIEVRLAAQSPLRGESKPTSGRAVAVQGGLRE